MEGQVIHSGGNVMAITVAPSDRSPAGRTPDEHGSPGLTTSFQLSPSGIHENHRLRSPRLNGVSRRKNERVRFNRVTTPELKDPRTVNDLWRIARKKGWVGGTEAAKLGFFGLVEHALAHGDRPAALLVALLKRQAFHFITQAKEDRARNKIREMADASGMANSSSMDSPNAGEDWRTHVDTVTDRMEIRRRIELSLSRCDLWADCSNCRPDSG